MASATNTTNADREPLLLLFYPNSQQIYLLTAVDVSSIFIAKQYVCIVTIKVCKPLIALQILQHVTQRRYRVKKNKQRKTLKRFSNKNQR